MSAERFVELLQSRRLVPPPVIDQLRGQIAKSTKPIAAQGVAKALTDKNLLSLYIATQLLEELQPVETAVSVPTRSKTAEDDFGLVPFEAATQTAAKSTTTKTTTTSAPSEKPSASVPAQPKSANTISAPQSPRQASAPVKKPVGDATVKPLDDDPLFGGGGLDDLFAAPGDSGLGDDSLESQASYDPLGGIDPLAATPGNPTTPVAIEKKTSNSIPWKQIAIGFAVLSVCAVVLTLLTLRDDGDAAWNIVQSRYDASPADAADELRSFAATYPNHPKAGTADVYLGAIALQELKQRGGNPRERAKRLVEISTPLIAEPDLPEVHPLLIELLPDTLNTIVRSADSISPENRAARDEIAVLAEDLYRLAADPRAVPFDKRNWRTWQDLVERTSQLVREKERSARLSKLQAETERNSPETSEKLRAIVLEFPELSADPAWQAAAARVNLVP